MFLICTVCPYCVLVLALGLVLTGVGAAMTVDMQLVPNPADGIVSSISERTGKELGLCTILSMIGVGRVTYLFNRAARVPLRRKAGLED